jgi:zinc protease
VEELLASLDPLLAAVREQPVTEAELDRAKARLELSLVQGLETVAGKAEQIGFYETVLGDPSLLFTRLEAYRRVTLSDLLRVARRYLVSSSRTVIEVIPEAAGEGEGDDDEGSENECDEEVSA